MRPLEEACCEPELSFFLWENEQPHLEPDPRTAAGTASSPHHPIDQPKCFAGPRIAGHSCLVARTVAGTQPCRTVFSKVIAMDINIGSARSRHGYFFKKVVVMAALRLSQNGRIWGQTCSYAQSQSQATPTHILYQTLPDKRPRKSL